MDASETSLLIQNKVTVCPHGHGKLKLWNGELQCWTCGWTQYPRCVSIVKGKEGAQEATGLKDLAGCLMAIPVLVGAGFGFIWIYRSRESWPWWGDVLFFATVLILVVTYKGEDKGEILYKRLVAFFTAILITFVIKPLLHCLMS